MNMMRMLMVGVGLVVLIILGIIFVMLPVGWKFLPMLPMAVVVAVLMVQFKPTPEVNGDGQPEVETGGMVQDVPPWSAQEEEPRHKLVRRANRVFGPIMAGLIIDLVDFATFGPIGLVLGLPVGGIVGYWMGRALGFGRRGSMWCAVAAGVYCTIPGTEFIPLATIVGACARFQEKPGRNKRKRKRKPVGEGTGACGAGEDGGGGDRRHVPGPAEEGTEE